MSRRRIVTAAICCAVAFLCLSSVARSETLTIGGTGSALGAMKRLGDAFEPLHPDIEVQVLPSLGSSGGIRALRRGAVDLAVSARPLKETEKHPGFEAVAYGTTAVVFATASDVGTTDLSTDDLMAMFRGTRTKWPNGQDVRIILRPEVETDTQLMRRRLPGMDAALQAARQRNGIPVYFTDQDNADALQRIPGSLGTTSLNQDLTEHRHFKIFRLNGIEPSAATVDDGTYPLTKTFYFVTGPGSGGAARRFINFARSAAGVAILRNYGHCVPCDREGG